MDKYILAYSKEDRDKLLAKGFEFCSENKIGDSSIYIFYNNEKYLTFSNEEKEKYEFSNSFILSC